MNNTIKRTWNQNSMVIIEDLQGMAFQAESGGHTFQISGIDGEGNAVALSGTPAGVMLRADGQDVTLTCSVSGGVVSATLPANAYSVPGRFGLTIFLTSDGQKTAIYAAVGTVGKTSSGTVAPPAGSDVVTLVNQINTAIAAIPANYNACFAPAYSTSGLYSVGQYVTYNGNLYRCNTAITTAETWTAAHWTQTNLGADVYDLKSALTNNIERFFSSDFKNGSLESGIINTAIKYRVASNELYSYDYDVCITPDEDFQFAIQLMPGGTYFAMLQCKTGIVIKAGMQFKIYIRRITENTSEIADVSEFVSKVHIRSKNDSKAYLNIMDFAEDEHHYIKFSDGSKVSSGEYMHTYYIPAGNIKRIEIEAYNTDTTPAVISFFSTEEYSQAAYMSEYSVQFSSDNAGANYYVADVPEECKLIAITHNSNVLSWMQNALGFCSYIPLNEFDLMDLYLVGENQTI